MHVYRSSIFTPLSDPFGAADIRETYRFIEDGYVTVDPKGVIREVGEWSRMPPALRASAIVNLGRHALITPGFVDAHLHGPQLEMIGSYGGHLLEWLNQYTFPTEMRFADEEHAREVAVGLFRELLRNGTLASLIFCTTHPAATDIFFQEAEHSGARAIIGKAMMDRNAPDNLLESADASYAESRRLLTKWHGRGLLRYAISPRFAPTSTPALLEAAGQLKREFPDAYVHTHVSENASEVQWVRQLFPDSASYVDVYRSAGLLSDRTVLAHAVHLTDDEIQLLADSRTRVCHCPNSNLFLGSGLFPMEKILSRGVIVGLGSDIGAGTTPSMFNAMADAYKVQQVLGVSLSPVHLWYLGTLGGARALSLDSEVGSLEAGKDADFIVLDLQSTPLLARRTQHANSVDDLLAGLIFMGDDRVIQRSYVKGVERWRRDTGVHVEEQRSLSA
jgi:guanine deaminase